MMLTKKRMPLKRQKWASKASSKLKDTKPKKAPKLVTHVEIDGNPVKIWGLKRADTEISIFIREKYGKCQYPECEETRFEKLQCSHYIGRKRNSTRFLAENLIALCRKHHFGCKLTGWEFAKQRKEIHGRDGEYTLQMKAILGAQFPHFEYRAQQTLKEKDAIIELMLFLHEQRQKDSA